MARGRIGSFKNYGKQNSEEIRRRRTYSYTEQRKAWRHEKLTKVRNIYSSNGLFNNDDEHVPVLLYQSVLKFILDNVHSFDPDRQFEATMTVRRILSQQLGPLIDTFLEFGVAQRCVQFLSDFNHPSLQFEAAWVLTNIASGTTKQTHYVVNAGAVKPLINLLKSPHLHIAEQGMWALGNIIGDGPILRDHVIMNGILPPLITLAIGSTFPPIVRTAAWTLSNICHGKNGPPSPEVSRQCLPVLAHMIQMKDIDVVANASLALAYLCEGSSAIVEEAIKSGIIPGLVKYVDSFGSTYN